MADDPVLDALSEVATVMFPMVYAPEIRVGPHSLPDPDAMRHLYREQTTNPVYGRAVDAIRRDPTLAPLLGDDTEMGVFISQDTGMGWRLQSARQLPHALVETAAKYVLTRMLPTDSVEPLLQELSPVLRRVRRLISGEPDTAAVLTAFQGIGIADGAALETPWGVIRAASSFERDLHPFGGASPSAVLETDIPLRWALGDPDETGGATISREYTMVDAHANLLALSALLAFGQEIPTRWLWRTTLTPLGGRSFHGAGGGTSPFPVWADPPAPEPLTQAQESSLIIWAERVERSYDPSIAVAVRRTLSAVTERTFNAEDALIDAVIAWENLFGTGGTSEMAFRITTALAILLEPDLRARAEFRSDLGKVYNLRSKVAHGGEVKPKDHLSERKDQAIDVAIKAMRELLENHPSLISNPERGMELILGVATEQSVAQVPEP